MRPVGRGQRVALPDFRRLVAVQNHVHARQGGGGVVHLLPVDAQAGGGFVGDLDEQRTGATGRVVDGVPRRGLPPGDDDFRHHPRDLGGGVELSLALAALRGEVAHQVLVSVAQQVVPFGAVGAQVNSLEDADQFAQAVHHLLAAAQFALVVEIGDGNHAAQIVGIRQFADDFVDFIADFRAPLQAHHVPERSALRDLDGRQRVALVLVRDVFDEEQGQDVILVLRGVHAAAQFVAGFPKRGVQLGFLECHKLPFSCRSD